MLTLHSLPDNAPICTIPVTAAFFLEHEYGGLYGLDGQPGQDPTREWRTGPDQPGDAGYRGETAADAEQATT